MTRRNGPIVVRGYDCDDCGLRWSDIFDRDMPVRDGKWVCPRCELTSLQANPPCPHPGCPDHRETEERTTT